MFCSGKFNRFPVRGLLPTGVIAGLLFGAPERTWADAGRAVSPEETLGTWSDDPVLLLNLLFCSWLFARGILPRLRSTGRHSSPPAFRQGFAFAGGMLALILALVSPLDVLSDQLSWAHMLQHLLLMMVAAPLFILAGTGRALFLGLPRFWRKRVSGWQRNRIAQQARALCRHPLFAWSFYALVLWIWHVPHFYQAALNHLALHDLQHLSFFVSALLYWRVLFAPASRLRLNWGAGVLYLFTTSLHAMALGVLMALSPEVWYPAYEERSLAWGLTALEDQQIAGFLMWMPAGMMYGVIAAVLFGLWLQQPRRAHVPTRLSAMAHPTR